MEFGVLGFKVFGVLCVCVFFFVFPVVLWFSFFGFRVFRVWEI